MRIALFLLATVAAAQTPCEQLRTVPLDHGRVVEAGVAAGVCRVFAVLEPTADSHIEMETRMPVEGWNGKFLGVGNGGFAGSISTAAMVTALQDGYATASTDTGHKSTETPGGSFALGHPEKLIDYGHRAVHEMTVAAKKLVGAYYGRPARLAYWNSCSNGGREALMEAQRYPEDYDAIVAGAPALDWSGRALQSIWVAQALHRDPASYIPAAKYPAIHAAALAACDVSDGVKDGLISDPSRCKFDPGVLQCAGADGPSCLTAPQIAAARKIYEYHGTYPGLAPGSELGWGTYGGAKPFGTGDDHFKYVVFGDPKWDFLTLDFSNVARFRNPTVDAVDPNLRAFFGRGGKLIQYHGWADPQIPPMHSIDYYKRVVETLGRVDDSYRLFLVPGMAHCGGGEGPNQFDALGALERWKESGTAPERITAYHVTNNKVDVTRPLCPYPQVARHTGAGNTRDAENFVCAAPR
jgi:feruloyl esterase